MSALQTLASGWQQVLSKGIVWGTVAYAGLGFALAQGTLSDYQRADGLRALYRDRVFRQEVSPTWAKEPNLAWYKIETAKGRYEFVLVDPVRRVRQPAFDHEKMAETLGTLFDRDISSHDLPMAELSFGSTGKLEGFRSGESTLRWHQESEKWEVEPREESGEVRSDNRRSGNRRGRGARSDLKSPNGAWSVEIRNHNVWLISQEDQGEFQLSFEGSQGDAYIEQVYWAPNSSRFVAIRRVEAQEHPVTLLESSPDDQLQPKLHTMNYLKPGDRVAVSRPQLFEVQSKTRIPVSNALFGNPYHLRDFRWAPNSKTFYFVYNQRGHQVLRVMGVDGYTGHARALVDEKSETFIDYAYKQFKHYLHDDQQLIWMSERDGWNHLYLYDLETGALKHPITQGEWVVRHVDHVDEEKRVIWFRASGVYANQDPYYLHAGRVNFDGSGLTFLTQSDGTHTVHYSPDREFLIATHSRVDLAPVTELRSGTDGRLLCELERASLDALTELGWRAPERFVAKGRDGVTDIHGVIYRPSHFRDDQRYPVIEHIYAGPHGSHVPKTFRAFRSSQVTAELGFIVVRIDGMGTSNRSKAFHNVCWQNLKDAGFPDRIRWMRSAAERYPSMDLTRVGIYGGSAGGQNTVSALLHHPEFYKVGVADCGCHDNRMDKIWWNELWMGWPVGPHYAENSNVTHASKLKGKLFLTVGELDRNVDPASTLQLVDALIKAEKDFDFMMVPGAGHGVGDGSPYMIRRRQDFFVRHLYGVEPRVGRNISGVPVEVQEAFELDAFYEKYLDNQGFPILSSGKVSDYALREANYLIDQMLEGRDDIRRGLIDLGFRFSVMAYDEFTTDIPEHSDLTPTDFWDRRARGLGASQWRPSVSCGEENLLQFPGDPYQGESILIHEFAHAIHEALRVLDAGFDDQLEDVYQAALAAGLWKGKYAATNRYEYWAECVQSFFDDNRENDRSHNHVDTREELQDYDPRIYELIHHTFRGNEWRFVPVNERDSAGHLAGLDRDALPTFVWPEHLKDALKHNLPESGERVIEIVEREIEGWKVHVDIQLLEGFDERLGHQALALLKHQLFGIKLLMPADRLEALQRVRIRMDRDNHTLRGIQYHPSKRWLVEHGHDPRLAKMVHIPQADAFVSRSLSSAQPRVILHELAHGYHDQVLGFGYEPVLKAYRAAVDSGRYQSVLHIRGHQTRHYALTDQKEYFAEGTEAYFGANDFYPFVRSELKEHDVQLFERLKEIWGTL